VAEGNSKKAGSRRVVILMTAGFIIAIVLVGFASLIWGYSWGKTFLMVGWLVLMIIFTRLGFSLTNIKLTSFLRGIAAVSLGGALSIGGGTTISFVTADYVQLEICNYCDETLTYEWLDIEVAPNSCKLVEVPPVTVVLWQEGDCIFVRALGREEVFYKNAVVYLNGEVLDLEKPLTIDLSEKEPVAGEEHLELIIRCKS